MLKADAPRLLVVTWQVLYDPELRDEHSRVTYAIAKRGQICKILDGVAGNQ